METTIRMNTEKVLMMPDEKDFIDINNIKVIFINPEGKKEVYERRNFRLCKTSNVCQIQLDKGKKYSFFRAPKNFDNHIFIAINKYNLFVLDPKTAILLQPNFEIEEVEMFLREVNNLLQTNNEIFVIKRRSLIITCYGWIIFIVLMISAFSMLGAGIYTSFKKTQNETTKDNYNNFKKTFEAPFYIICFLLIGMAVIIYFSCVRNKILKDYHKLRLQISLYKNKVKKVENKYNKNFFSKKGMYVSVAPNLDYIHFSLNSEIIKIMDLI